MAQRPVFIPSPQGPPWVEERIIEFTWHPGFALSQARKSIESLHQGARKDGIKPILEISSKSPNPLGRQLSAFQLSLWAVGAAGTPMSVECAFQGSKVFQEGGPYTDLYKASSRQAKRDPRIRESGDLVKFQFMGTDVPTEPKNLFYDWLYLMALNLKKNSTLAQSLLEYAAFSDIAFNPRKSINCQARAAALYVAFRRRGVEMGNLADVGFFRSLVTGKAGPRGVPGPANSPASGVDTPGAPAGEQGSLGAHDLPSARRARDPARRAPPERQLSLPFDDLPSADC